MTGRSKPVGTVAGQLEPRRSISLRRYDVCSFLCRIAFCWLLAESLHAADPCDPNRKFAGRITLIIVGAGELETYFGVKGVDDDLTDTPAAYAWADFHLFRRHAGSPAYSIVMTSNRQLAAKLNGLPAQIKTDAGFLGTVPASEDAFEDLLSDDANTSPLQKAINNLSQNPECRNLMKSQGFDSVLPLLKTEIVLEGHNTVEVVEGHVSSLGLPLWTNKNETGSYEYWSQKPVSHTLDQSRIARLRAKLGHGLLQVFIEACYGGEIGQYFQGVDQCSCVLSATDSATKMNVGGVHPGVFVGALPDKGVTLRALKTISTGMREVAGFHAQLLAFFESYFIGSTGSLKPKPGFVSSPIFAATHRINPLLSFSYTSADYKVETILTRLRGYDVDRARCDALLAAGFAESLPDPIAIDEDKLLASPQLARVLQLTALLREIYAPFIKDSALKQEASAFAGDMKRFRGCANYEDAIPECSEIQKVILIAEKGTSASGKQTRTDINLLKATTAITKDFDESDAPTLISKYHEGKLTISELFTKLVALWKDFAEFEKEINSYADNYYKGDIPKELRSGLDEMSKSFKHGMKDAQLHFFPLLRKGALEVRLARIEEAAKMFVVHREASVLGDPNEILSQLANDLVCLTAFPVGPAFDRKYAKELNSP